MIILVSGLVMWMGVHFFPGVASDKRKKLMLMIGVIPYKLSFATLIICSIVLMTLGWQSVEAIQLYVLPEWVNYFTRFLVLLTFILFVAAQVKTNIKRVLRHPQLTEDPLSHGMSSVLSRSELVRRTR